MLYSLTWKGIHLLAIVTMVTLALISMFSFSEPVDIHCNIVHEYEQEQNRQEEEREKYERMVAEALANQGQDE